jgi:hypothetical protein
MVEWTLNKEAARKVLEDPESYGTTLHAIVLKAYGYEAIYGTEEDPEDRMDPIELFVALEDDFHVSLPVEVENKINAIIFATESTAFFENPVIFSSICMALGTGDLGDLINGVMEEPTIPEMVVGILEVQLNHDEGTEFLPAVQNFIESILDDEGIESLGDPELDNLEEAVRKELFNELKFIGVPEEFFAGLPEEVLV